MKYDHRLPFLTQLTAFLQPPSNADYIFDIPGHLMESTDVIRYTTDLAHQGFTTHRDLATGDYFLVKPKNYVATPPPPTMPTRPSQEFVDSFKLDEARLLRKLEHLDGNQPPQAPPLRLDDGTWAPADPRWLAIARTHFEEGFAALQRAFNQPQRMSLPEDDGDVE